MRPVLPLIALLAGCGANIPCYEDCVSGLSLGPVGLTSATFDDAKLPGRSFDAADGQITILLGGWDYAVLTRR